MTETEYLANKNDRTVAETVRYLLLRLDADNTKSDAKLFIAYSASGVFRRVLADRLTGDDIRRLCEAASPSDGASHDR